MILENYDIHIGLIMCDYDDEEEEEEDDFFGYRFTRDVKLLI